MCAEELWGGPGWFGASREDRERAEGSEAREVRAEVTDIYSRAGWKDWEKRFKVIRGNKTTGANFQSEEFGGKASRFKVRDK